MYFSIFLKTFSVTSFGCFLYDVIINKFRVKKESRKEILNNYINSLDYVIGNLFAAKLYLDSCENYLRGKERNNWNTTTNIIIWLFFSDIIFYFLHYLFHTKYLYYFHKIHHRYIYTYGITSIYAHPVDFVMTNLVPISAVPLYFHYRDNIIQNIIKVSLFFTVVISHGGYNFFNKNHLYHHVKRRYNYGLNFSDRFFGTFVNYHQ